MRAIQQSFKYGITSALLIILVGGVQACAEASPLEPIGSSNARYSATTPTDTIWTEGDNDTTECVLVNGQIYCQGKPR